MQKKLKYRTLDILSVVREPLLMLFMIMPPFAAIILRILVSILSGVLDKHLGFDLMAYAPYIQSMVILMVPMMLGMFTAFIMLDEMDLGLIPLMRTMPGSLRGYLLRRFLLPAILTVVYIPLNVWIMGMMEVPFGLMLWLILLGVMQMLFFASLIFSNSPDKVAGLAIGKASGLFMLPCFAPLLSSSWTLWVARLTPLYYITAMLKDGFDTPMIFGALVVNAVYLAFFFMVMVRRIRSLH